MNDQVPLCQTLDLIQALFIPDRIHPSLLLLILVNAILRIPAKSPCQQPSIAIVKFAPPRQSIMVHNINKLIRCLGTDLLERLALTAKVFRVDLGRRNRNPLSAGSVSGV